MAYWDTEESGRPPYLLGEYKGTPTIRMFVPKAKQKPGSYAKKQVLDYQYERTAVELKKFAEGNMPNFLESIKGMSDLQKFQVKAEKYGLPRAILFTSKAKTLALTKYLSTEFRRKLLIAEVHPTKLNQEVIGQFDVKEFPAILVFPVGTTEPIVYDGDGFSRHKLHSFLSKHALKKPVLPPKKTDGDAPSETNQERSKPKPVGVGADGEL